MGQSLKETLYLLLEDPEGGDIRARRLRLFLVFLILLNVLGVILETMEEVSIAYRHAFRLLELISVGIFSIEYAARVFVGGPGRVRGVVGRIRYALSPLMIIALRLMRLMRVLKLGRYSDAIHVFFDVVRLKREQLAVAGFCVGILLVVASSLMYHFEHLAQPSAFASIPHAMWWAVITLTTVGYGDVYPVTEMGRFLASVIALIGIGMFALPAGILSAGFVEYGERKKRAMGVCPHCGGRIHGYDDPD
jgi:voltage-gated potassium channel